MKHIKVSDHNNLLKDLSSGAVINNDNDAYRSALSRKKDKHLIKRLQEDCDALKERVSRLEEIIFQYK
jgi:hypothetical protein